MLMLNWPLVLVYTVILYVLMIICLPFNQTYASMFLFQLIAFWSRLPGVGILQPTGFPILYLMDVIDIFSVIVAVNLGGVEGAMFSLCGNVISRLCGVYPEWKGVFEDSVAQFLTCLIIPFVHVALGGNILVTVIAYTVIRIIIMLPMDFVFYCTSVPKWIIEIIIGTILIIFINIIYVKLFGDFFDNLLKRGMNFSWILFIFATAVIIIFYASVFGFSKTIKGPSLIKIIKHYIHKPHKDKKSAEKNTDLEDMRKIKEMMK